MLPLLPSSSVASPSLGPVPFHLANDLDPELMHFWGELQRADRSGLLEAARGLAYAGPTFAWARDRAGPPDALAFLVRNRMSRDGLGKHFSWSERLRGKTRPGGPFPGDLNGWEMMVGGELSRVVRRLALIRLTCRDALESIRAVDAEHGPDVVHYCDPPYLHSTRTVRKAYAFEMTDADHSALLATLRDVRGTVLLSGYRSALYDAGLAGWHRAEFDMPNHSGQGRAKQRRVECLWSNRPLG